MNISNRRLPSLRSGELLLYPSLEGYRGHICLAGSVREVRILARSESHFVVEAGHIGEIIPIGTLDLHPQAGKTTHSGKKYPEISGQIAPPWLTETFHMAAWRSLSAGGVDYLYGSLKPIDEATSEPPSSTTTPARFAALAN